MMDPQPLAAHDSTPFENRLLSAARSETIPTELKLRMSQGLNLGAAAISAPAAFISLNTIALVVVGAAAIAGLASVLLKQSGESHTTGGLPAMIDPAHTTIVEATSAQPATLANPTSALTDPLLPAQVHQARTWIPEQRNSNATPTSATRKREVDLHEEIGFLDTARAALAAGAPDKALSVLGQYSRRSPHGTFAPEAIALRIEALSDAGDGEQARTLARRFLKAHPDSPLAERVERLTGAR